MNRLRLLTLAFAVVAAGAVVAEEPLPEAGAGVLPAPFPAANTQGDLTRIAPAGKNNDDGMLTTHEAAPPTKPVEAKPADPAPAPSPFQRIGAPVSAAPVPAAKASAPLPAKIPFGRAEPSGPVIPSAPHKAEAVPVMGVDAVEASDAAPPTPVAPEADPAQEDPAEPTELTSPIFVDEQGVPLQRKIIIRALNKVTAQSELLSLKPGEKVNFGQLEITALTCRTSSPSSQTDYAGLLDIVEKLPEKEAAKSLFHGWMYASSPSIAALEHPVYDVTMIECRALIPAPATKKDDRPAAPESTKKVEKPMKKTR